MVHPRRQTRPSGHSKYSRFNLLCWIGVEENYKAAFYWLNVLQNTGVLAWQPKVTLGTMYEEGLGVPQDYVRAHMWYNLYAADSGQGLQKSLLEDMMTQPK